MTMTKGQAMAWVVGQIEVARAVAAADHGGEIESGWEYDHEDGLLVLGPMSSATARGLRGRLERLGLEASDALDSDSGESWVYLTPGEV